MNKVLITIASVVGLACTASASTISFSTTITESSTPFSTTFQLQGFNTALGTLTGITIGESVSGTPSLSVINTTGVTQMFTNGNSTTPVTVTGPDASAVTVTESATGISGTLTSSSSPQSFSGTPVSGAGNSVAVPTADFTSYESTGLISGLFTAASGTGTYSGSAANGVYFGGGASVSDVVTITYTYGPSTPEPTTMALLGLGLIGCGLVGRKRLAR